MSERSTGRAVLKILTVLGLTVVGVGVLFVVGYYGGQFVANRNAEPAATAAASTSAAASKWAPMKEPVPADSDCKGCHGSSSITPPKVPNMAHPVEGWTNCLACHNDNGLVKTAPGHSGIHKEACLMCHKPPADLGTALKRPHHVITGQDCTTCHNGTGKAPLPASMSDRKNCWVCHTDASKADLFPDSRRAK